MASIHAGILHRRSFFYVAGPNIEDGKALLSGLELRRNNATRVRTTARVPNLASYVPDEDLERDWRRKDGSECKYNQAIGFLATRSPSPEVHKIQTHNIIQRAMLLWDNLRTVLLMVFIRTRLRPLWHTLTQFNTENASSSPLTLAFFANLKTPTHALLPPGST